MAKSASWSRCLGLVIGVCVLLHGLDAQQPGSTLTSRWCHGDVCYHLYRFNDTTGGTWGSANDQCHVHGLRLTAIPNQEIQNALQAAPPFESNEVGRAWLAGRRSDDDILVWLNNKVNDDKPQISGKYPCGALSRQKIVMTQCLGAWMCICQRNESDCPFDTVSYRDTCVWIIRDVMSWYNCRMKCNAAGGDLASLLGGIPQLMIKLNAITAIDWNANFWIGLQRNPWSWISGSGQQTSTRKPMVYYRFVANDLRDCLFIDMATSYMWSSLYCFEKNPYFVCDDGPLVGESDNTNTNGRSPEGGASGLTAGALAGILVVVFGLVVVITVLAVILWRRHRRVTSNPDTNSPTGLAVVGTPTASLGATGTAEKEENFYCEPTDFEKPSVNPVDTYLQKEV